MDSFFEKIETHGRMIMEEFLFESIRGKKTNLIKVEEVIHEDERKGLGNYASIHLNKKGGFFIYLLLEVLNDKIVGQFNESTPECRILTKGDKSYMLINFSPNLPISEFLFDISIYKTLLEKGELMKLLKNSFQIALVDSTDKVKATKVIEIEEKMYKRFETGLISAFSNPNFSREYRVFLIPFYEKSTDRWWNIIKEV